ncbi:hypothetical protein FOA43_002322 [Brettanomyces nanus]|uniref:Uncharacterized protein n=1 Tax=Eeniella nana TaxID=13502 RepID=A0A875S4J2_EENNA|nr:uncharacterized protein FOA43_002322 [Brettanomyces nanus]QPG74982.1 hypothetical protein FOA43_002322 [Brettanomyces nanus]
MPTYGRSGKCSQLRTGSRSFLLSPTKHTVSSDDHESSLVVSSSEPKRIKLSQTSLSSPLNSWKLFTSDTDFPRSIDDNHSTLHIESIQSTTPDSADLMQDTNANLESLFGSLDHRNLPNKPSARSTKTTFFNIRTPTYNSEDEEKDPEETAGGSVTQISRQLNLSVQKLDSESHIEQNMDIKEPITNTSSLGNSLIENIARSSRTYGATRSFKADETRLSEDEGENEDDYFDDQVANKTNTNIQSTLDLRISGMNNQFKEEVDIFIEDYGSEDHLHNKLQILMDFKERISEDNDFGQFVGTTGLPAEFIESILKPGDYDTGIGLGLVEICNIIQRQNNNHYAVILFCRGFQHRRNALGKLLAETNQPDKVIEFLGFLAGKGEDIDISLLVDKQGAEKILETIVDRLKNASKSQSQSFLHYCIQIYSSMMVSKALEPKEILLDSTDQILQIVINYRQYTRDLLVSVLQSGVFITSTLDVESLPETVSSQLYSEPLFQSLLEIAMRSKDSQLTLFALGYLVNFTEEDKFINRLDHKSILPMKSYLDRLNLDSRVAEDVYKVGYFCLIYSRLLANNNFVKWLTVSRETRPKLIIGLRRFNETIPNEEKLKDQINYLLHITTSSD